MISPAQGFLFLLRAMEAFYGIWDTELKRVPHVMGLPGQDLAVGMPKGAGGV